MEITLGILFLAMFVEGLVSYIFRENNTGSTRWYILFISLAIGVALAIAYKVNIPAMVGINTEYQLVNYIISGVLIGRGSNYLNDFIGYFRKQ